MLIAVPVLCFAGPAAAQSARVNSTVSIQVQRAASFEVDMNDVDDDMFIHADIDDTAASVTTRDEHGEGRSHMTLISRDAPLRVARAHDAPRVTFVQIAY